MALVFWKGHRSGDWSSAANWSGNREPGPADRVLIATAKPQTITVSSNVPGASILAVAADDTLAITAGELRVGGAALIAGAIKQSGGTLSVGPHSMFTGNVDQTGGTLAIRSGVLSLDGTNTFGGTFAGSGTIDILGGSDTLTGQLVYPNVALKIASPATLIVDTVSDFASIVNAGTIEVMSGAVIETNESGILGGTIEGDGTLNISDAVLRPSLSLEVATWDVLNSGTGSIALESSLTFGGTLLAHVGTFALGGYNLTLTGNTLFAWVMPPQSPGVPQAENAITGAGTLTLAGTATIYSLTVGNLVNANSVTEEDYRGGQGVTVGTLVNQTGATWGMRASDLDDQQPILYANTVDNLGTITSYTVPPYFGNSPDGSAIGGAVINEGLIQATSGTLTFLGSVSGAGTLALGTGTTMNFSAGVGAGQTALLGAGTTLGVNAVDGFGATITDFAAADIIGLNGMAFSAGSTESFDQSTDRLTVSNGSVSTTLRFAGSYSAGNFALGSGNGGNTLVTYHP